MAHIDIENSLLALILAEDVLWPALSLQRVQLQLGPIPSDPTGLATWIYFPVDALISLSPLNSQQAAVATVGQHGCVQSSSVQGSSMQAHVISPGQAYCVDWHAVSDDPTRQAHWLRYSMAATQGLIGEMAQWAFCVQHHTAEQRLASWVLHCIAQSSNAGLNVEIASLPLTIRHLLAAVQPSFFQPSPDGGMAIQEGCLRATATHRLRAGACSCYQKMARQSV